MQTNRVRIYLVEAKGASKGSVNQIGLRYLGARFLRPQRVMSLSMSEDFRREGLGMHKLSYFFLFLAPAAERGEGKLGYVSEHCLQRNRRGLRLLGSTWTG